MWKKHVEIRNTIKNIDDDFIQFPVLSKTKKTECQKDQIPNLI